MNRQRKNSKLFSVTDDLCRLSFIDFSCLHQLFAKVIPRL